jgi:hypothetical protein
LLIPLTILIGDVFSQLPDYENPVVLQNDKCTVEDFCNKIHRTIIKELKFALVWGSRLEQIYRELSQTFCLRVGEFSYLQESPPPSPPRKLFAELLPTTVL